MFVVPPAAPVSPSVSSRAYTIRDLLRQTPAASLYRADLMTTGGFCRPVAIKFLRGKAAHDADELARLRDEARLLGQLRHRAIVGALGLVQLDGEWALVMEEARGVSLEALLSRGPLPPAVALEVIEEVASALDAAWNLTNDGQPLRLVHRALDGAAVYLTTDGGVRVVGFHCARADFAGREAGTRMLARRGAPDSQGSDPAADIYALGTLLFAMIAGYSYPPAAGAARAHATQLREALATLPMHGAEAAGVRDLLEAMLALQGPLRPGAREVARRCERLRQGLSGPSLRAWAAQVVRAIPEPSPTTRDPRVGRAMREGPAPIAVTSVSHPEAGSRAQLIGLAVLLGGFATGALVTGAGALWLLAQVLPTLLGR